jgi:PTS system nitrogen regulatory IIA component
MKLVEFLSEDRILPDLQGRQKHEVIAELGAHLARATGAPAEEVVRVLLDRERLASTAVGEGVAIPHGKLDVVPRLTACLGRSRAGVDFESVDGKRTHLFVVLLAPENSTGVHLKALARISRLFKDADFRARLLAAPNAAAIYAEVVEEDGKY